MSESTPEITPESLAALVRRVEVLEAEAEIRRVQTRYMFLCDTPNPEHGVANDKERIELILDLYTEDAIWEGVGEYYDNQFGRAVGKDEIRAHFNRFWPEVQEPQLLLNAHYLTSEQIHVHEDGETADGQWIHFQPWLFSDGKSLIDGDIRLRIRSRRRCMVLFHMTKKLVTIWFHITSNNIITR